MRVDLTYHHLTHHIVPGPQSWTYFVPLVLLPVALLIPRSKLSRWQSIALFMPIMTAATVHGWTCIGGVDVISVDKLLWCLFLLALHDPWRNFRRVKLSAADHSEQATDVGSGMSDTQSNGHIGEQRAFVEPMARADPPSQQDTSRYDEQAYPQTLPKRIPWVGTLLISICLNTWKIGLPSHDKYQPPQPAYRSRRAFVAHAMLCFMRGYLLLDLTRAYISYDGYFTDPGVSIFSPLPFKSLQWLPPHIVRTTVVGAQAWALISQMFYLPCLIPVGLHTLGLLPKEWSPHVWPPYFGSPRLIYMHGVRGFWGSYWHQTMRYSVSGPGYALADALRLRRGGLRRYALITAIAFGFSGTVHMGLVPPEPLHATIWANSIRLLVAGFFWAQPIAMVTELIVAKIAVRVKSPSYWQGGHGGRQRMLLNTVWVVAWFSIAIVPLAEAVRQMGYWRVWPVPVSLWKGLRGEGWNAWPFLMD